jgi:hypothetical protein
MHLMEQLASGAIERLGQQGKFLRRIHQEELAKNPLRHATKSSRSNLRAVQHIIKEMYREAVARGVVKDLIDAR